MAEPEEGEFSFCPLDPKRHDRNLFSCGEFSLDNYLRTQASQDAKRRFAACFVASTFEGRIAGYYTLSSHAVLVTDLPLQLQRKIPAYPTVPACLLGRLAVDLTFRSRGLGGALLADALSKACRAEIPAFAMVVDAMNEAAASFYVHHGFMGFASAPQRFFLPLSSVPK
jgi:ribosomal protein S18 acetylase RimI-like enzyme